MQLSAMFILIGIGVFWVGVAILMIGKKADITYVDVFALGRRVYDKLDKLFERPNVLAFKVCSYSGLFLVLVGVAATFLEK